jgi:undecaprenyl-phosphate 4-deoxy-4-formamido-L-arabinose transferase
MATHQDRYDGKGNYSLSKSISLWLKMATNFSLIPLRLTSLVGLIASFTGFALSIYLVIAKIFLGVSWPTGWTSLMLAIITFGGIQLLALGIIGEYLGRVLLIANGKQQYIILKTTETNVD